MKMFFMDPKRPAREPRLVEVTVKECKKTVWGITADGKRHLIGSSLFQTLASANRAREPLLRKLVNDSYVRSNWATRGLHEGAVKALKQLKVTLH